jgi:hypothetical protein
MPKNARDTQAKVCLSILSIKCLALHPWRSTPRLYVILALPSFNLRPENHLPKNIILTPKKYSSSTLRRHTFIDRIRNEGINAIRPCSYYISAGESCRLSSLDERYKQYYRGNRSYNLASPWAEDDRLKTKKKELREKRLRAEAEAVRIRKAERKL